MHQQRRLVDRQQIGGVIHFGERAHAVVLPFHTALHGHQPEVVDQPRIALHLVAMEAVERHRQIFEELRAIARHAAANAVEGRHGCAFRVGRRLQHQRRHGAHQHHLRHPIAAVAADVARHFAAADGVADQDQIAQIQRFNQQSQIVGVLVDVVTVPGLIRTAVAAAIVGDHPEPALAEKQQLVVPGVGGQRPTVGEQDRLAAAPILVENARAIGRGEDTHDVFPARY